MKLEGSCHCKAVSFSAETSTPQPYQRCYCSICRKTNGGGGYAINIMVDAKTMQVSGNENITIYNAMKDGKPSPMDRAFCKKCGSGLWVFADEWPDLLHPFASTIDTPLPQPISDTHILLNHKAVWVSPDVKSDDVQFEEYPDLSIADWHAKNTKN